MHKNEAKDNETGPGGAQAERRTREREREPSDEERGRRTPESIEPTRTQCESNLRQVPVTDVRSMKSRAGRAARSYRARVGSANDDRAAEQRRARGVKEPITGGA